MTCYFTAPSLSISISAFGARMGGEWPNAPQKLLASVSENLQRFTKQLQPHSLDIRSLQGTKTSHPKASQAQSLQERGCRSHQINVEDEGVLTPLQVIAERVAARLACCPASLVLRCRFPMSSQCL